MSDIALDGGAWQWTNGIARWVPWTPPAAIRTVHDLTACPTCRARVDESCRSDTGRIRHDHASRLVKRTCPCGGRVEPRKTLCAVCCAESIRRAQRESARRRRAGRDQWEKAA